ncbi:MAG: hypothetical protein Q9217_005089 [Psora testacea]
MALSLYHEARPFVEISLSEHDRSNDQCSQFHTTSPPTASPLPKPLLTVLQDQSSSDQHPDWRVPEATRILQSCDVRNIELLCHFGLCKDETFPANILQGRQESRLDIMLKCLSIHADNWDRDTKVRAILERLAPKRPLTTSQRTWTPFHQMDGMDASGIADDLDEMWCDQFKEIPFEDWVRWAQGYSAASVADFLDRISASRD